MPNLKIFERTFNNINAFFRYLQGTTQNKNVLDVLALVWFGHSPAVL